MKDLFSEFPAADTVRWRKQIERDLKGENFDSLLWQNDNGFTLQPFYTKEDLKTDYYPAFSHTKWRVAAEAKSGGAEQNKVLLRQLRHGADAIWLNYSAESKKILAGVDVNLISLSVSCKADETGDAAALFLRRDNDSPPAFLFPSAFSRRADLSDWIEHTNVVPDKINCLSIPATLWSNSGALPFYEIALTMSAIVDMLDASKGRRVRTIAVRTAVDSDLFVQVAKLRALRRLWEQLKAELGSDAALHIQCETALTNKSAQDPYNNLLRTTVECTGAILGGCNDLLVHPYDVLAADPAEAGIRLALNQQHILREESYLDRMADVSCGSYYIETLTDQLAERALETFKTMADSGGYFAEAEKGSVKKEIAGHAEKKKSRIRSLEELIVGINKFRPSNPLKSDSAMVEELRKRGVQAIAAEYELLQSLKKA